MAHALAETHPKPLARRQTVLPTAPAAVTPSALHPSSICTACGTWVMTRPGSITSMACPECGSPASLKVLALQPPPRDAPCDPVLAALSQTPSEARCADLDVAQTWIRAVSQPPPLAGTTPPVRCADTWVSLRDDAPPHADGGAAAALIYAAGPHEPWLLRSSPPTMHVLSSACAMCGKMRASVAAVLAHPDAAPQPSLFCVAQSV